MKERKLINAVNAIESAISAQASLYGLTNHGEFRIIVCKQGSSFNNHSPILGNDYLEMAIKERWQSIVERAKVLCANKLEEQKAIVRKESANL